MAEAVEDTESAQAPPPSEPLKPIIIKKKVDGGHAGAHGGAWKIALADMMTAMMAFFLLMWLLGAASAEQRKSVADYFKPTSHSMVNMSQLAGTGGINGGQSILDAEGMPNTGRQTSFLNRETPRSEAGPSTNDGTMQDDQNTKSASELSSEERQRIAAEADKQTFDALEKEVREKLAQNTQLDKIKDQVQFIREKEGLRIEIIDKADFSMFSLGTDRMQPKAVALIQEVAKSVAALPNKVAVRGHTDSLGFGESIRNNWSLSGERAESTRRLMQAVVPEDRFARIEGVADTVPYNAKDPADPRNRRISVTILYQDSGGR